MEGRTILLMRTLEITIAFILLVRIMVPLIRRDRWIEWISMVALGVMGLHLLVEGYRWQMIPLYGITLGLGIFSIRQLTYRESRNRSRTKGKVIRITGGVLIVGLAIIPPLVLPIPKTPRPTGPYPVGTITLMLVDETRQELYSGVSGEPRTLMVQIWYPAETEKKAKPTAWLENMDVMGPAISAKLGMPGFFLDHVKYARSNAIPDAPISNAGEQYPLLLFSHGWGGFRAQNTYQMEELASYGYVVAAPDHTYGSIATVFPDGQVAPNNPEALPTGMNLSNDEFLTAVQVLGDQWAGDMSFILDTLMGLRPDMPAGQFTNRLDFTRVGALGHSTGGGAAIQFCGVDERCKAVLGMDPYMDPVAASLLDEGLEHPIMAIFSEVWEQNNSQNNDIFETFSASSSGDVFHYYIEQTAHYDFTDMAAFSPLSPYLGFKGPLNGAQVLKIINAYTLAFFGLYFNGEAAPILEHPSPEFPEMIFISSR